MSAHNSRQPANAGSPTAAPDDPAPDRPGRDGPGPGATRPVPAGPGQAGPDQGSPGQAGRAALEALDALLDPRWYITVLITGDGRIPCLTVSSRHARLTWDIHATEGWYWSAEVKVAPFGDPGTTASVLAEMLDGAAT
jgi:hypothetical protein